MSAAPRPLAAVTLDDGQTLRCGVLARARGEDGRWWYTLRAALPGVTLEFRAPYPTVQPIPGQAYDLLDGEEPAAQDPTWRVTRAWRPAGQLLTVHGDGCWLDLKGAHEVTREQAAELLRDGAVACDVCEPAAVRAPHAVSPRPENE